MNGKSSWIDVLLVKYQRDGGQWAVSTIQAQGNAPIGGGADGCHGTETDPIELVRCDGDDFVGCTWPGSGLRSRRAWPWSGKRGAPLFRGERVPGCAVRQRDSAAIVGTMIVPSSWHCGKSGKKTSTVPRTPSLPVSLPLSCTLHHPSASSGVWRREGVGQKGCAD